jgi:hypothetical protein
MTKLVLHIGMNKTGSTAIQSSLRAAAGSTFLYPALGEPPYKPHHEDGFDQVFSKERLQQNPVGTDDEARIAAIVAAGKERIREAAAAASERPVILSSEGAYRYLTLDDVKRLHRFVEPLFDDVQILAYVRDPFGFISAAFHNWIKGHGLANFKLKYQPYRRFEKFDRVFGRDRVRLFKFDRSSFPNGDVVAHFCDAVGLPRLQSGPVNVTLCRPAVSAIYRLNRLAAQNGGDMPGLGVARKAIIRRFPHREWPKFRLSPHLIAPVIDEHVEDMGWIEERMGCSLREDYPPQDGDVTSEADLLQIDADALQHLQEFAESLSPQPRELLSRVLAS